MTKNPTDIFEQLANVCPAAHSDTSDIITVVIDEKHTLGKSFTEEANGSISKKSAVSISRGIACQFYVPGFLTLEKFCGS